MSLNAMYMLRNVVTGAFEHRVGKWQGAVGTDGKVTDMHALLVLFKIKNKNVQMLIHAPANYVGVYARKEKGKWKCISYHDSCWRSDGVERFLFEHREDMRFTFSAAWVEKVGTVVEHITDAILVVALSQEQLEKFRQIRKKKYE